MARSEQELGFDSPNTQQSRAYLADVLAKLGRTVRPDANACLCMPLLLVPGLSAQSEVCCLKDLQTAWEVSQRC